MATDSPCLRQARTPRFRRLVTGGCLRDSLRGQRHAVRERWGLARLLRAASDAPLHDEETPRLAVVSGVGPCPIHGPIEGGSEVVRGDQDHVCDGAQGLATPGGKAWI